MINKSVKAQSGFSSTYVLVILLGIALALVYFMFGHNKLTMSDVIEHSNSDSFVAETNSFDSSLNSQAKTSEIVSEKDKALAYKESVQNNLPQSLVDLPLPALLNVDANGELIVNSKIKNLFDFYLGAIGEESLEDITNRTRWELEEQLQEPALSKALGIYFSYLDYMQQVDQLKAAHLGSIDPMNPLSSLSEILFVKQGLRDSRRKYFDQETVSVFFAKEDEYDHYMLSRAEILSSEQLSTTQKEAAIASLQSSTPEWLLLQERESTAIQNYMHQEQSLLRSGASKSDVQNQRLERFGEQAAENLNHLDSQRAEWDKRLQSYRSELNSLLGDNADTSSALFLETQKTLRTKYFTGSELNRISALDSVHFGIN